MGRVEWFQMALMQASTGKLKTDKIFQVITDSRFSANLGAEKKKLKSAMLANLHLFSGKQKKAVELIVKSIVSADDREIAAKVSDSDGPAGDRKGRSSSSGSTRRSRSRGTKKKKQKEKDKDRQKDKEKDKEKDKDKDKEKGREKDKDKTKDKEKDRE